MHGYFRKLRVKGNIVTDGNVTASTGSITAKTITGSSSVTASKGFQDVTETRTTLAQLVLTTYGTSFIDASTAGTSATRAFTLGPPAAVGVRKTVIIKQNTNSTRVISFATTAAHYNSTRKSWQTVTGKARLVGTPWAFQLMGTTALTWAVVTYPVASTALTYT